MLLIIDYIFLFQVLSYAFILSKLVKTLSDNTSKVENVWSSTKHVDNYF